MKKMIYGLIAIASTVLLSGCGDVSETERKTLPLASTKLLSSSPKIGEVHPTYTETGTMNGRRAEVASGTIVQIISNPGFEDSTAWIGSSGVLYKSDDGAFRGKGIAYFGGYNNAQEFLYQDVTIPDNALSAELEYWYAIASEQNPAPGGDRLTLSVVDPNSNTLFETLVTHSNATLQPRFTQSARYALNKYRGQKIRLRFSANTDTVGPTQFLIDEVTLNVQVDEARTSQNTLVIAGWRNHHTIQWDGSHFTQVDIQGNQSSLPANITTLEFYDAKVSLDIDGLPGKIYRLYQAAFNRQPDPEGLGYWIDKAQQTPYSLEQLAEFFVGSSEFVNRYGSLNHQSFVQQVYTNVLGRPSDEAGLAFYVQNLERKAATRSAVMTSFSESKENKQRVMPDIQSGITYPRTRITYPPGTLNGIPPTYTKTCAQYRDCLAACRGHGACIYSCHIGRSCPAE